MDAQDNKVNGAVNKENEHGASTKGNEDKKIFVGGIAYDTTNEDLTSHFTQYGEVSQAQVKFDRVTGRSRGFAFVEFVNGDSCKSALAAREQTIKGKAVEVKPAKSRENKKVFVGGLPSDYNEAELRTHFEQFGKVEDIEWPFDKNSKQKRNFCFVVFELEEDADKASAQPKQTFGHRECDVKKAVPQSKRYAAGGMGRGNGMRPYGAAGGGRGAGANNGGWYGAWGQMGAMPYGGAAWGDWYSAAAAGNYYPTAQNGYNAYGAGKFANGSGYESYQPQQAAGRQNGGAVNGNRYAAQQQF